LPNPAAAGNVAAVSGSVLFMGFLLGLKHALEADHVAAVATLANRASSLRDHVRVAGLWGVGHGLSLAALGALLVLLGAGLPAAAAAMLEAAGGVVLIALGLDVLRRLRRDRVHFHVHRHADAAPHFHAHTHRGQATHDAAAHDHHHPSGLGVRALAVGSLHGLGGSAALALVAAEGTRSVGHALAYLALFGAGTVLGMTTLSLAIALPFRLSAERLGYRQRALEAALGTATIALGVWIAWQRVALP
jgi:cytochrome c biogenesis protein CcdA